MRGDGGHGELELVEGDVGGEGEQLPGPVHPPEAGDAAGAVQPDVGHVLHVRREPDLDVVVVLLLLVAVLVHLEDVGQAPEALDELPDPGQQEDVAPRRRLLRGRGALADDARRLLVISRRNWNWSVDMARRSSIVRADRCHRPWVLSGGAAGKRRDTSTKQVVVNGKTFKVCEVLYLLWYSA